MNPIANIPSRSPIRQAPWPFETLRMGCDLFAKSRKVWCFGGDRAFDPASKENIVQVAQARVQETVARSLDPSLVAVVS